MNGKFGQILVLSILAIQIPARAVFAQSVPGSYDDYDLERYQRMSEDARDRVQRTRRELEQTQRDFDVARSREESARQNAGTASRRLDANLARQQTLENENKQDLQSKPGISQQIQQIDREISDLNTGIQSKAGDIRLMQQGVENLRAAVAAEEKKASDAQGEVNSAQARVTEQQAALEQASAGLRALQGQRDQAGRERDQAVAAADSLRKQYADKNAEISRLQQQHEEAQKGMEAIDTQMRSLQQEIFALNAAIQRAYQNNDPETAHKFEAQKAEKEKLWAQLTQQRETFRQRVVDTQDGIERAKKESEALSGQVARANDAAAAANAKVAELDQRIAREKESLAPVQAELARRQEAVKQAQAKLASQQQQVERARQAVRQAEGQVQFAQQELAKMQQDLQAKQNARQAKVAELAAIDQRVAVRQQELNGLRNQAPQLQAELQRAQDELARASRAARDAQGWVEEAQRKHRIALNDAESIERRMNQVRANIERAHSDLNAIGASDGRYDGAREGNEVGAEIGSRMGTDEGRRAGQEAGTAEGKRRWYDEGFALGKEDGIKTGRERALQDAQVNGKRVGTSEGTAAGLQAAYSKGYADGSAAANDAEAYKQGYASGSEQGLAKAKQDAAPEQARGYSEREKQFLSAPLKPVTVTGAAGGLAIANGFRGIQSRPQGPGDGRYYRPRPASYPHPRLVPFYMEAYDANYRDNLAQAYESAKTASYNAAYASAKEAARAEYAAKPYPDDKSHGYSDGKAQYDKSTYNDVYPGEYSRVRQAFYDQAFQANQNDAGQIRRGYADGNRQASSDKGSADGERDAYAKNIGPEKILAYGRGAAQASDKYTNNAVLEIVGVNVIESEADGVVAPGEGLLVQVLVKNYGLKAKTGLRGIVQASNAMGSDNAVPGIEGQSLTTINGAAIATVNSGLDAGVAVDLTFQLLDGQKTLVRQGFQKRTAFPLSLQLATDLKVVPVGEKTSLKLVLSNGTLAEKKVRVVLSADPTAISASGNGVGVVIPPQGKGEAEFLIEGRPEHLFRTTQLSLRAEGQVSEFKAQDIASIVGQRHRTSDASAGLLIGADLSSQESLAALQKAPLDTWDLRIDGQVTLAVLKAYQAKLVILATDEKAPDLDAVSAQAILQSLQAGGMLMIAGDPSELPAGLRDVAHARVGKRLSWSDSLVATEILKGTATQKGAYSDALALELSGNAAAILLAGSDAVSAEALVNEFADQPGRVITLGLRLQEISNADLSAILKGLAAAEPSFDKKLQAAKSEIPKMGALIQEMREEVRADDANSKKQWFHEKGGKTKLGRALDALLDKDGSDRSKAFAGMYPDYADAIAQMKDQRDQEAASNILDHTTAGFFGNNWKGYYCKYFGRTDTHKICK